MTTLRDLFLFKDVSLMWSRMLRENENVCLHNDVCTGGMVLRARLSSLYYACLAERGKSKLNL